MTNILTLKIITKASRTSYGVMCCTGEIFINSFKETFEMPIEWWSLKDYQQQWHEGLRRIKNENNSCLVTEVENLEESPRVSIWPLYKVGDIVFIQQHMLFGNTFKKQLKDMPFTPKTCYNFICKRERLSDDGITPISEWKINLHAITQ